MWFVYGDCHAADYSEYMQLSLFQLVPIIELDYHQLLKHSPVLRTTNSLSEVNQQFSLV